MTATRAHIVVCDDEELIRWSLGEHLGSEGYRVTVVADGQACIEAVNALSPNLVLMDLKMPTMDGLTALRRLREQGSDVPVIVITAHGAVDSAIEATQLGAVAYMPKPFDLREISLAISKALAEDQLRNEVRYLRGRERSGYGDFLGRSPALDRVFEILTRLEDVDASTVLIQGESGTGKDVIARMIHQRGGRADQVFVEVDCAALPELLIESELFGHERGAFTDARTMKRGLLEVANGGVVFLDEIGEMSIGTQAKLLRALENRQFKRVGGLATISTDVTILAATNRDLKEEVRRGNFREDLFFRLNVVPIRIPPLRDRRDDIPMLVEFFVSKFNRAFQRDVERVSGEALTLLTEYGWPGNVRELRNVLERIVILNVDPVILPRHLPPEIRFGRPENGGLAPACCPFVLPVEGVDLEQVERGLIQQALERTAGNQSAAARLLGITRYALRYRMEKYELATA